MDWGARAVSPQLSAACRQHLDNELRYRRCLGKAAETDRLAACAPLKDLWDLSLRLKLRNLRIFLCNQQRHLYFAEPLGLSLRGRRLAHTISHSEPGCSYVSASCRDRQAGSLCSPESFFDDVIGPPKPLLAQPGKAPEQPGTARRLPRIASPSWRRCE